MNRLKPDKDKIKSDPPKEKKKKAAPEEEEEDGATPETGDSPGAKRTRGRRCKTQ